ncbi:tryptophan halogenase family protein [Catenovulum maritimum]|uniref:Tryptophan halogenase n=1 Tax=Catenovulum maritimum TaxID=1513271 RepID=A0A0J8GR53_9ALTE|nr:tryptophan halogenase family protein [Catenovulum maritimum]KMT63679.1 hypothetical protein XM47_18430 [Catenovulum maritimum]
MENPDHINSYVILGGGTAGWMSAAILARALEHTDAQITVIESPHVPSVGVGEATIPSIIDLLNYLNISQIDFVSQTDATFKLAIRFVDWLKQGTEYWHPFGKIGSQIDGIPFYQHWLKQQKIDPSFEFTDFSPAVALSKQNKFFIPDPKNPTNLSSTSHALHFDASKVAQYLQKYCLNKNVNIITDHLVETDLSIEGNIKTLHLESGRQLDADFFIDCSGQKALLIGKALRVGYDSWQDFLPVDSAVAMQTEKLDIIPPYTLSTAAEHGWRWQIPLQNRTGNGYVYASDYCNNEEAIESLIKHACTNSKAITDPKVIKFVTGKRKKMWHRNCLSVGLSTGFLEPLESTSIYLIMRAMLNFVQVLPSKSICEPSIKEYNRLIDDEYNSIRDFIVLHYCVTQRKDTKFWRMWQNLSIPDSLSEKLALFKSHGRLYKNPSDLFSQDSWYAVLEGMKVRPTSYDPLVDRSNFNLIKQSFIQTKQALWFNASETLNHEDYLKRIKRARMVN